MFIKAIQVHKCLDFGPTNNFVIFHNYFSSITSICTPFIIRAAITTTQPSSTATTTSRAITSFSNLVIAQPSNLYCPHNRSARSSWTPIQSYSSDRLEPFVSAGCSTTDCLQPHKRNADCSFLFCSLWFFFKGYLCSRIGIRTPATLNKSFRPTTIDYTSDSSASSVLSHSFRFVGLKASDVRSPSHLFLHWSFPMP